MRRRSQQQDIQCAATRDTHDDQIHRVCASELDDGSAGFTVDHDRLRGSAVSIWPRQQARERFASVRFEPFLKLGDRSRRDGLAERPLDRARHDQLSVRRSRQALRVRDGLVAGGGKVRGTQDRFER